MNVLPQLVCAAAYWSGLVSPELNQLPLSTLPEPPVTRGTNLTLKVKMNYIQKVCSDMEFHVHYHLTCHTAHSTSYVITIEKITVCRTSHSRRPEFSGYLHTNLKCDSSANTNSNLHPFSYFVLDLTTDTLPMVVLTDA
jgi:hypothetical protein